MIIRSLFATGSPTSPRGRWGHWFIPFYWRRGRTGSNYTVVSCATTTLSVHRLALTRTGYACNTKTWRVRLWVIDVRAYAAYFGFPHPFYYLRTFSFSFLLPRRKSDPGSHTGLSPPLPTRACLHFCRESISAPSSLVNPPRIAYSAVGWHPILGVIVAPITVGFVNPSPNL